MMNSTSNSQTTKLTQKSSSMLNSHLKDQFKLSFLDCQCCCEASKEMNRCQKTSSKFLNDLQEYLYLPEYRLNCQCICGDNNEKKTSSMNFGIHLTPANDLK